MRKIILIGAGGHAKSCIDVIKSTRKYKIIGILDKYKKGRFENIKILGNENYLNKIKKKTSISVSITVGQIKSYRLRENLFEKVKNLKFNLPKIVSKYSLVSKKSSIDQGTMIFHNVFINSNVTVGKNCIINTSALLEHDVTIGDNCHISTGSILNGGVIIGNRTFIGSGSRIKEGVKVGNNCIIGMGSIIKKDISDFSVIKK